MVNKTVSALRAFTTYNPKTPMSVPMKELQYWLETENILEKALELFHIEYSHREWKENLCYKPEGKKLVPAYQLRDLRQFTNIAISSLISGENDGTFGVSGKNERS